MVPLHNPTLVPPTLSQDADGSKLLMLALAADETPRDETAGAAARTLRRAGGCGATSLSSATRAATMSKAARRSRQRLATPVFAMASANSRLDVCTYVRHLQSKQKHVSCILSGRLPTPRLRRAAAAGAVGGCADRTLLPFGHLAACTPRVRMGRCRAYVQRIVGWRRLERQSARGAGGRIGRWRLGDGSRPRL